MRYLIPLAVLLAACGGENASEPEPPAAVGCVAGSRQVTLVREGVWRGRAQFNVWVVQFGERTTECRTIVMEMSAASAAEAYSILEDQVAAYLNALP
jgi:hypothetical protein